MFLMMNRILRWTPLVLGALFLLSLAYLQRERALKGQNDFAQLYTAAKLVGTPDLYSRQANLATIQAIHGFTMETVVYTRPPFYAALLKPLAAFPYRVRMRCFLLPHLPAFFGLSCAFRRSALLYLFLRPSAYRPWRPFAVGRIRHFYS